MTTRVVATDAHEGPVFVEEENSLYFTSVPHRNGGPPVVAIKRMSLDSGCISTVRSEANVANGMTRDPAGCLLVCEQGTMSRPARISRFDCIDGRLETVVDSFEGKPLNSPNDIVVKSDGTIWFTDPSYGWLQGFRPKPVLPDVVYRFDPSTGEMDCVASSFEHPNGLAFSPDEATLYVGDSGEPHQVQAFDVVEGRGLDNERVFVDVYPGYPDGLKTDAAGRVYVSSSAGVQIFDPDGMPMDLIPVRDSVNFAFAGSALFITNDTAIWKADLK
ncbi:MAG TPA: SMP-30/gluconolactonase/LRE family protein [Thermoleophilaceae bacterium]|nr:SMP-30/gluconolactonase/LRE family protein [Thermoleophilaceae bacterium]